MKRFFVILNLLFLSTYSFNTFSGETWDNVLTSAERTELLAGGIIEKRSPEEGIHIRGEQTVYMMINKSPQDAMTIFWDYPFTGRINDANHLLIAEHVGSFPDRSPRYMLLNYDSHVNSYYLNRYIVRLDCRNYKTTWLSNDEISPGPLRVADFSTLGGSITFEPVELGLEPIKTLMVYNNFFNVFDIARSEPIEYFYGLFRNTVEFHGNRINSFSNTSSEDFGEIKRNLNSAVRSSNSIYCPQQEINSRNIENHTQSSRLIRRDLTITP